MINWADLKPFEGDVALSFEELAFQVAKRLYGEKGRLTRVDDRGGGDGVEFYLTLPNGDEWGWQAKFFPGRLRESNRKNQIRDSLRRACDVHPRLTKWFLCTPSNFTPDELSWFHGSPAEAKPQAGIAARPLPEEIPMDREVELVHWGTSEFSDFLSEPSLAGKRHYFFGRLELNLDWFKKQFEKQVAGAADRFNPLLHIETDVDRAIHNVLGDATFIAEISTRLLSVGEQLEELDSALNQLKGDEGLEPGQGPETHNTLVSAASLGEKLRSALETEEGALAWLKRRDSGLQSKINWTSVVSDLENAFIAFRGGVENLDPDAGEFRGAVERREARRDQWFRLVLHIEYVATQLLRELREIANQFACVEDADLHVLGAAGTGKTHLACHICEERLRAGLPALLVLGRHLTTNDPLDVQLRNILGIHQYSWGEFLQALGAAAEMHRTQIPIVIDGLNEAVHHGRFSPVLRAGLPGLVAEISGIEGLALITTCRTTYRRAVWSEGHPAQWVEMRGFDASDVGEAVSKYFEWYRIVGDVTLAPLSQFRLPIYLKLFCEVKNPERDQNIMVYVGQETLFEVFDQHLTRCNLLVAERLHAHPAAAIVPEALRRLADHLWENRARYVSLDEAYALIDGRPLAQVDLRESITAALLDEGLLIERDWYVDQEGISFTYDLLAGYLIAHQLVGKHQKAAKAFLSDGDTTAKLFGDDYRRLHPMYEDVGRCLAAVLPRTSGAYLHELTDSPAAHDLSIAALFEIEPALVDSGALEYVARQFESETNRARLFSLATPALTHVGHRLNATFWSAMLRALSLPDRDLSWSEHIRRNLDWHESFVAEFEGASRSADLSVLSEQRVHLAALHVRWCLTSTVRRLRDRATRAMYYYGRRWPDRLAELLSDSLAINDPYVPERLLAAAYGVAMARQHDHVDASFTDHTLPRLGRAIYESMFAPDAPHSTTHLIARDYAKHTIDVAVFHHPHLLTAEERTHITPPFQWGGMREWGRAKDKNKGQYRGGNCPIDFDNDDPILDLGFGRYDRHDTGSYAHGEAHLWWRIYDLGYSLERFGEADKRVAALDSALGGGRHARRADHYGRKYCRIATFELAGLRDDVGLLEHGWHGPGERLSFVDIDPSFPAPMPEVCVVGDDFLGDRRLSLQEWILGGGLPNVNPFLIVDQLEGQTGPWVLLDGDILQDDAEAHRNRHTHIGGLIVRTGEADSIVRLLERQVPNGGWFPRTPWDTYRFACEVPWCETFPPNGWEELELVSSSRTVQRIEEQLVVIRDGQVVPIDELDNAAEILMKATKWFEKDGAEESEEQVELRPVAVRRRQRSVRTINVLIPVREDHWEDHHCELNPRRSHATPSREITDFFGLVGQPGTFDLLDKNRRTAAKTLHCGDQYLNGHWLTYLRQDLLEAFLRSGEYELVWVIWGERRVDLKSVSDRKASMRLGLPKPYRAFQTIVRYWQFGALVS